MENIYKLKFNQKIKLMRIKWNKKNLTYAKNAILYVAHATIHLQIAHLAKKILNLSYRIIQIIKYVKKVPVKNGKHLI